MSKSSIVEVPEDENQWGKYWNSKKDLNWNVLQRAYSANQPVWLFGKGPSFHKDFDVSAVKDKFKCPPVAVNQACTRLPTMPLTITNDFNIYNDLPPRYQRCCIAGVRGDNWPHTTGSGNYALMILAELGVKDIITVGIDNSGRYGVDYGKGQPECSFTDSLGLIKGSKEIIEMYDLNIIKYDDR